LKLLLKSIQNKEDTGITIRVGNDLVMVLISFDYTYFLSNFWVQRYNIL